MSSPHQARAYHHPSDFTKEVWAALLKIEAAANIILPFARKASKFPRGTNKEQLWIVLYDDKDAVEFMLSCTKGPLGNYPIFIVSSKSPAQIDQEESDGRDLAHSLLPLIRCLLEEVPPQRVFSVFSIAKVAEKFAEIFVAHTGQGHGIRVIKDAYYDATFSFCTRETFNESLSLTFPLRESEDIIIGLYRADMSHLEGVKELCKAFSATSPPFVLDDAGAELEARILIDNEQVWVHLVQKRGEAPEIACLVATTRESDNVTAVTKVFTAKHWRSRGCAARLLQRVCQEIFQNPEKRVVLYVGNSEELVPARKVYSKIGFQGLDGSGGKVDGVERWVEVGFEGTTLGYW